MNRALFLIPLLFYTLQANSSRLIKTNNDFVLIETKTKQAKDATKGVTFTNGFDYLSALHGSNSLQANILHINESAKIYKTNSIELHTLGESQAINGLKNYVSLVEQNSHINLVEFDDKKVIKTINLADDITKPKLISSQGILYIISKIKKQNNSSDPFASNGGFRVYAKDVTLRDLWKRDFGIDGEIVAMSILKNAELVVAIKNKKTTLIYTLGSKTDKFSFEQNKTISAIVALNSGGFLILANDKNGVLEVAKYSSKNKLITKNTIETTYKSTLYNAKELNDGKIIAVGKVEDKNDTDALAMLLDEELNIIKQEHYGEAEFDSFYQVEQTNDNNFLCFGVKTKNTKTSNYLLKIDTKLKNQK